MATVEQFQVGLQQIENSIKEIQKKILLEQHNAQNKIIGSHHLADLLSVSMADINRHYGRLGHLLADAMNEYPIKRKNDTYQWWNVISTGIEGAEDHGFLWKMRPELAEALENLEWVQPQPESLFPDEIKLSESNKYEEGAKFQVLVNAYERSLEARKKCIEFYGAKCVVCGFDFETIYGQLGEGFIHVHHEKPLSTIKRNYKVDPKEDLKPVCPNCHAMLHRTSPALSIQTLTEIIKQRIDNLTII